MTTETQAEQASPSVEDVNPDAMAQPKTGRVAYRSTLAAVVIGMCTIGALWLLVLEEGNPVFETSGTKPSVQHNGHRVQPASMAVTKVSASEAVAPALVSLPGRIDRILNTQQSHVRFVKRTLTALAEGLQTIKGTIVDLAQSNRELGRRIRTATSRLDTLTENVRALKVAKRKRPAKHPPRPARTPPFQIDAIDVWDDATYVAVSQAGHMAFLKSGERRAGWTVTRIDRLKGEVTLHGPARQAYSVVVRR